MSLISEMEITDSFRCAFEDEAVALRHEKQLNIG